MSRASGVHGAGLAERWWNLDLVDDPPPGSARGLRRYFLQFAVAARRSRASR